MVINVYIYWYGQNRIKHIKKLKNGSGGIGFFVKNHVLEIYKVKIFDDEYEGIDCINTL